MTAATAERTGYAWRNSYDVEDSRAKVGAIFWDKDAGVAGLLKFRDVFQQTAEAYAAEKREAGKTLPITHNAQSVLKALFAVMDSKTGRCDPSLDEIAKRSRLGRRTVVRLLANLRALKLVDWVRRTVAIEGHKGKGWNRTQTSNAYFINLANLPEEILRTLRQRLGDRFRETKSKLKGSGAVPGHIANAAAKLVKGLSGAFSGGARGPSAALAGMSEDDRLAHMYAGDLDAIAAHKEMMGLSFGSNASANLTLYPAPRTKYKRNEGA